MKLVKEAYRAWDAEVVFITSNFQGNKEIMEGCKEAGIPAFVSSFASHYRRALLTPSSPGHALGFLSFVGSQPSDGSHECHVLAAANSRNDRRTYPPPTMPRAASLISITHTLFCLFCTPTPILVPLVQGRSSVDFTRVSFCI